MTALDRVLAGVEEWEPDTAAIGIVDADGLTVGHGPTDTVLPFASVTKPIAAYTVLLASQDGLLHLDEPVDVDGFDGVTVRHLLAHAGGLPPEPDGPASAPGTRRVYSNWAYDILGSLVADRSGQAFADLARQTVLSPLGMTSTHVEGSPARDGAGTVDDLLRFAAELLDPKLLNPELHAEATTVAFAGLDGVLPGFGRQRPNDWGLGFELRGDKEPHWTGERLPPETFGHFGQSGSFLWVDPTRRLACVSLANEPFGAWSAEAWPTISDAIVDAYDAATG